MMLAGSPCLAQEVADAPALVDALVVNARTPGPAWWSVTKGEVRVWVLGTGVAIPANAAWDTAAFEKRLKATHIVSKEVTLD